MVSALLPYHSATMWAQCQLFWLEYSHIWQRDHHHVSEVFRRLDPKDYLSMVQELGRRWSQWPRVLYRSLLLEGLQKRLHCLLQFSRPRYISYLSDGQQWSRTLASLIPFRARLPSRTAGLRDRCKESFDPRGDSSSCSTLRPNSARNLLEFFMVTGDYQLVDCCDEKTQL
jgi:hypothetical protein